MAHKEQVDYVNRVKKELPDFFNNKKVLGVGTFNVCGTEDEFFDDCEYYGLDLGPGPGVDIVCPAQDYDAPDNSYDVIISCECFEHNPYWLETFFNMWRMTKLGGLLIFSCATTGRGEHGTSRTSPQDSPLTIEHGWNDYYKNLTQQDFTNALNFQYLFETHTFQTNETSYDLYFAGVKNTNL
jgi:SAM-dependent methyltransferase